MSAYPGPGIRITSMILAVVLLLLVLLLHLLPALLAGLLVYTLVQTISPRLGHIQGDRARMLVVTVLGVALVSGLTLLILESISFFRNAMDNPDMLFRQQLVPLLEKVRQQLPSTITAYLPDSMDELRLMGLQLLHRYAEELQRIGKETARILVHLVIGLVLGAIVAMNQARPAHHTGPLSQALVKRCQRLSEAFHHLVFAQMKIAFINALFTGVFLLVVLPLLGIQVPLAHTLVVLTFMVGLLPVIGNLISNTAVTLAALSVSLGLGLTALIFLIVIHKFEYILNARFVGSRIRAHAWELLLAMLLLHAAFGLMGMIAAPVYYAWLKQELETEKLI